LLVAVLHFAIAMNGIPALSRRTLRQEKSYALQNILFRGEPKIAVAILTNHVETSKVIEFRKRLGAIKGSFKNSPLGVIRKVVSGTSFSSLEPLLAGKVSLMISHDPVGAAKLALEFNKKYPQQFLVLGGCYEGNPLNQSMLKQISELPEDPQARRVQQFSALCNMIQSPTVGFYRSLDSYSKKWVGGMLRVKQHIEEQEKKAAAPATDAAAPAATTSA
jgi:large subunit ribosomal protein L10